MEKNEFVWKYQNVIEECRDSFLDLLKRNKVERINFEQNEDEGGELMPLATYDYDYAEICRIRVIERYDDEEDYDQYRVEMDNGEIGYINKSETTIAFRTEALPWIYCAVVDAIENGRFEKSEE